VEGECDANWPRPSRHGRRIGDPAALPQLDHGEGIEGPQCRVILERLVKKKRPAKRLAFNIMHEPISVSHVVYSKMERKIPCGISGF
jgi:hypothetical protein